MANVLSYGSTSPMRHGHLRVLGNIMDLNRDAAAKREWEWKLLGWVIMAGVSVLSWSAIIMAVKYLVR